MKYIFLLLTFWSNFAFAYLTQAPGYSAPYACTIVATPADVDMTVTGSFCRRVGKMLFVDSLVVWSGAGTAGALTLSIASLPGSPQIDTSVLPASGGSGSNQNEAQLGYAQLYSAGAGAWFQYSAVYKSTTTVEFATGSAHLQGSTPASGSGFKAHLELPIVGWN